MFAAIRQFVRISFLLLAAIAASLTTHSALALSDQGVIYIEVASGTSEARWEIGGLTQATQALQQVNPCDLVTTPGLLTFTAAAGDPSAKQDAIGVDFVNGNGTNCAGIDQRGSTQEALTVTLGPDLRTPAVPANLRFVRLVLQLELKGTSVVTEIAVNDEFSGAPAEIWEVRGGEAVSTSDPGRDPADYTSDLRVIDCFEGGTDVAPDARDTCVVHIAAFGNAFTITANSGSTSLEGGRSIAGPSEIHLTDASGIYDCGDTITTASLSQGDVEIASAACRRLETNLTGCPTSDQCVAVPADIRFENAGYDLVLEFDEGDQCVAVQCQIAFAPYDLTTVLPGGSRTTTAIEVSRDGSGDIDDVYPLAGIETTYLQPPIVQFLDTDPEFYIQHCLEELVRHPAVELEITSLSVGASVPFAVGETITNGIVSAKVLSYLSEDGRSTLVYHITSGIGDLAAGDSIEGPSGEATVLTSPSPSSLIEELVGDMPNPDGAGYALLDYSPAPGGKPNEQGIQHACLERLEAELPGFTDDGTTGSAATDFIRILIDVYLQRDIRLSVRDR